MAVAVHFVPLPRRKAAVSVAAVLLPVASPAAVAADGRPSAVVVAAADGLPSAAVADPTAAAVAAATIGSLQ
jgi:hypothetical protein